MGKKIKILGKKYEMESELPDTYIEEITEYVETKFKELSGTSTSLLEVAILVILNITDELFQAHELTKRNEETAKQSIEILEGILKSNRFPGVFVMDYNS